MTQSPKCPSYGRLDLRVDGCSFLKQVVNAGEEVRLVFMDDEVQGPQAFVGRQIHRKLVLLYQDPKAGKLSFQGCEVDGCEALRSGEHRRGSAGLGRGPQPCLCLWVALFVSCVPGGAHNSLSPTSLLPNGPSTNG